MGMEYLIFALRGGVGLPTGWLLVGLCQMVSGLSGTAGRHDHMFRDFAKLARLEELTRLRKEAGLSAAPKDLEAEVAADDETSAEGIDEVVKKFEARNREVLAHEASHMAAAGVYARGGASYTYQTGPDGKRYAIGGEVSIDMSPVPGNPQATINKMMAIRAAAISPSDPSSQDMSVAAAASQIEAAARAQLNQAKSASVDAVPAMRGVASHYAQPAGAAGSLVNATA